MLREQAAVRARQERCVQVSGIAYHQQGLAIRRIDKALAVKTGLDVSAHGAAVVRIGVRNHARRARCQYAVDELPDEGGPMTLADHVGSADKLVNAARSRW